MNELIKKGKNFYVDSFGDTFKLINGEFIPVSPFIDRNWKERTPLPRVKAKKTSLKEFKLHEKK